MSFQIEKALEEIQAALDARPYDGRPAELYEPIRYMLSIGGKRMRPLLCLLGSYLYSGQYQKAIQPSLAVEVFHNFTLLHDDIMDKAPLRRGKTTVHARWNDNVAILSGDAMSILAYDQLLFVEPALLPQILQLFNRCAMEVCEGQQYDMNFETLPTVSRETYIEMIRLKTAVLLGFSLQMGALIGGASSEEADKLRQFGNLIGIGFQLKDDLLDVYGDQAKFGKQVGGDILANKKTFLLISALERAQGPTAEKLQYWLQVQDYDKAEKVQAVTDIYNSLDIKALTEQEIQRYFSQAFELLHSLNAAPDRKAFLESFTHYLINRES